MATYQVGGKIRGTGMAGGMSPCGCSFTGTMGIYGQMTSYTLCPEHEELAESLGVEIETAQQAQTFSHEHPLNPKE